MFSVLCAERLTRGIQLNCACKLNLYSQQYCVAFFQFAFVYFFGLCFQEEMSEKQQQTVIVFSICCGSYR